MQEKRGRVILFFFIPAAGLTPEHDYETTGEGKRAVVRRCVGTEWLLR